MVGDHHRLSCTGERESEILMREFKFRAWDDEEKKMYSPEDLEQPEVEANEMKTIYSYLSFGVLCIYDFRQSEPVELFPMQATGWYDKNQTEIYEGDVLQMEGALHQVIWSEETGGFILLASDGMVMMGGDYLTDMVEVAGNIYENPDLINYKG